MNEVRPARLRRSVRAPQDRRVPAEVLLAALPAGVFLGGENRRVPFLGNGRRTRRRSVDAARGGG